MVSGTYRDLFTALATSAAALTGLLFVALSVAPRPHLAAPDVIRQVRAAASLLAFINTLAVSLYGLVPGDGLGYPATVMGVIGLAFTAAGLRSFLSSPSAQRHIRRQLGLITLLLLTFGFELAAGIDLILSPRSIGAVNVVTNVVAASLFIGVARAWELVSDRDTGIIASLAVLTGHTPPFSMTSPEVADSGEVGDAAPREPDSRQEGDRIEQS